MHERNGQKVLAVCDKSILGKTFEEGKFMLNVKESFYGNRETPGEKINSMALSADQINISGEKAVSCLKKEQDISDSSIMTIAGVPHVQIIKL